MGRTIRFTIHLPPVTKKNSQQIWYKGERCPRCGKGKIPFVSPSRVYKAYEENCREIFPVQLRRLHIVYPVNIRAVYYMPDYRTVDISNLHSALHDVLKAVGVLADDSSLSPRIVAGTDGSRVLVDRGHPRTEVEITELEEDDTGDEHG